MISSRSGVSTTLQNSEETAVGDTRTDTKVHDGPGGDVGLGQTAQVLDITGPGASTGAVLSRVPLTRRDEDTRVSTVESLTAAIAGAVAAADLVGARAATAALAELLKVLESGDAANAEGQLRRLR